MLRTLSKVCGGGGGGWVICSGPALGHGFGLWAKLINRNKIKNYSYSDKTSNNNNNNINSKNINNMT